MTCQYCGGTIPLGGYHLAKAAGGCIPGFAGEPERPPAEELLVGAAINFDPIRIPRARLELVK